MHRTIHVFVDESGDLGFSPSSSRHIVAVALAVPDPVAVRRLVRRAHGRFGPRENRPGELKFNTGSAKMKRFILEGMARTDVRVAWSAVFKPGLSGHQRVDMEVFMASLCQDAIGGLMTATSVEEVCVTVDRRQTRENVRERFDQMIQDAVLPRHVGYFPPEVSIIHLDSQTSAGLQAADIIAGTVFRSLEKRDGSYLSIIGSKIVYSNIR